MKGGELTMAKCKGCGADIEWIKTAEGKSHPVDAKPVKVWINLQRGNEDHHLDERHGLKVGFISHFATCPKAQQFRKVPEKLNPEAEEGKEISCRTCGYSIEERKKECVCCQKFSNHVPF
jgi:hypothetical protein